MIDAHIYFSSNHTHSCILDHLMFAIINFLYHCGKSSYDIAYNFIPISAVSPEIQGDRS